MRDASVIFGEGRHQKMVKQLEKSKELVFQAREKFPDSENLTPPKDIRQAMLESLNKILTA